ASLLQHGISRAQKIQLAQLDPPLRISAAAFAILGRSSRYYSRIKQRGSKPLCDSTQRGHTRWPEQRVEGQVDGRVAPGSCTPRPSRPGESHPEALTDPCLSLSAHTARAIHGELALSVTTRRFLPLPVDQSGYDANDPPPSLHGHYSTS